MTFETTFVAGWGDMDFNAHLRNTAYLDKAVDLRMMYFAAHGVPMRELSRLRIGPVVMRDEVEYFREIRLLERIRATLAMAGLADDGSRFALRNEFFRDDGKPAARVTSIGGWLDLDTRKLIAPAPSLHEAMRAMSRTDDFRVLPSSLR